MDHLQNRLDALSDVVSDLRGAIDVDRVSDERLMTVLAAVARAHRQIEGLMIDAVGEVSSRSDSPVMTERLTSRLGCHDLNELVQWATLLSPRSARRVIGAATAVCGERALVSREKLEPLFPALREAMLDGAVGVDGLVAASGDIIAARRRVSREQRHLADEALAAAASGTGLDGAPPVCADLLRVQAQAWTNAFDQDGAEPRERITVHRRGFSLGPAGVGGVPVRGTLMPEVAAQFQQLCDAMLSPRAGVRFDDPDSDTDAALDPDLCRPEAPVDSRTRAQKQHDVLATVLGVAAASGDLPTVGGSAPTLVVSVREEDLIGDTGYAHVEGCEQPISMMAARHVACSGGVQRVVSDASGRIRSLGTTDRVFNHHQRRAIALRDGGCIIPGCGIRAAWCEIHHVHEHSRGGPTHTDNGVLLCWFHHRFLDTSGWRVRMNKGAPEVKAPLWWDHRAQWRPVTTSPLRLRQAVLARSG
ncbi:HNH endonuclease signature motif containing protein [Microbacterium sp. SLBN-146]|uniref:HNH endonuclease signature motif containing protein n=1 Tax=Microbacterium sp. SLBN-146 TaxID=2768457 RepID=UPI001153B9B2|nr:HNH endonuclease signature motif containing protein [Microbacterium sp. SLBN-146]